MSSCGDDCILGGGISHRINVRCICLHEWLISMVPGNVGSIYILYIIILCIYIYLYTIHVPYGRQILDP